MGFQAPQLLTSDEAARYLSVSTKTLRRLRDKGLPYVLLTSGTIRYKAEDLVDYVSGRTIECHTAPQARATDITTSKSKVVDFTDIVARKTTRKPRR